MNILITGGSGFIGSALARRFLLSGASVRVLDDFSRGKARNLGGIQDQVELISADIRDASAVTLASANVDLIIHLAYVNGTEYFYKYPDRVLDVGVRGLLNIIDAAVSHNVPHLMLASSSEVYQEALVVPTPEDVQLVIPNIHNPRYSYGGGKILYELMGLHYASNFIENVQIFRPHNVYGPFMGSEHVIPQIIRKIYNAKKRVTSRVEILGNGLQTRAFNYIDDFAYGIECMQKSGTSGIYHIGSSEEIRIIDLYRLVADLMDFEIDFVHLSAPEGETRRRCPDITKISSLGYRPAVPLRDGLVRTIEAYIDDWSGDEIIN